uniref:Uncharacterized protein n=1 Tax=Triticum urartu TaxID=4572 RepID=A0A8R7PNM8_TRIUA
MLRLDLISSLIIEVILCGVKTANSWC